MTTSWQTAKLKARQALHENFAVPVVFYESSAATPAVPDDVLNIRIHDKSKLVGDLAGTNLSYAEVAERPTVAIFSLSELTGRSLSRGAMVFGIDYAGNAFGLYCESPDPEDGSMQSVRVSPLDLADYSGKLLPDGSTVP